MHMNYKRKNNDSECDMYRRIIVELVEKIEDKDVLVKIYTFARLWAE